MSSTTTYPRETVELVPTRVTVDGQPVTSGYTLALTRRGDRPTVWVAPTVVEDAVGWLLDGTLGPGTYALWAKVASSPESPVILLGHITIT